MPYTSIAFATIAAVFGVFYFAWLRPGVNILRRLFKEGKIDSIYLTRYYGYGRPDRLCLRRQDGAEIIYSAVSFFSSAKPFSPTDDQDWAKEVIDELKDYSGWKIGYFARNMQADPNIFYEDMSVSVRGADGWRIRIAR